MPNPYARGPGLVEAIRTYPSENGRAAGPPSRSFLQRLPPGPGPEIRGPVRIALLGTRNNLQSPTHPIFTTGPAGTRMSIMSQKGQLQKLERGYAPMDYTPPAESETANGSGVRTLV